MATAPGGHFATSGSGSIPNSAHFRVPDLDLGDGVGSTGEGGIGLGVGVGVGMGMTVNVGVGVGVGIGGGYHHPSLDETYRQSSGAFGQHIEYQQQQQQHGHLLVHHQQPQPQRGQPQPQHSPHQHHHNPHQPLHLAQHHRQHHHHHHHQYQVVASNNHAIASSASASAPAPVPAHPPVSAGQFGILTPTPIPGGLQQDEHSQQQDTPYKLNGGGGKIVVNPPDLQAWREKLFYVDDMIVLTHDQFETYFPHVDNVYSHRSTQRYKRKPFISHYWDCRMKGRPPGTPKSDDPNKKKRKRNVRERDLCDVKIKITEYFPGAGAEAALDREVAAAIAAGAATVPADQRFWTIQRVNGNGGNGKGDGVAGPHKHTLAKSDEIKKNSVQRYVAQQDKETKKGQPKLPQRKATGAAAATVKKHSKESDLKLYAACFCPFSQRVWIALEAKGLAYQYVETDPFRRPVPMPLLEANPRGRVPAIRQGEWACAESAVILEYLEDVYNSVPLYPSDPRLKANCRLWIDYINTKLVATFFALLQPLPSHQPPPQEDLDGLQTHLTNLVLAADESGPFFLGSSLSLVDIHFAPFALRLSRVIRRHSGWVDTVPGTRWQRWLDALERNPHVASTTSTEEMYFDTADLLPQNGAGSSDGVTSMT